MNKMLGLFFGAAISTGYAGISYGQGVSLAEIRTSQHCGRVDQQVLDFPHPSSTSFAQSLRLYFDNFRLVNEWAGRQSKRCDLDAVIRVPAGTQFRAVAADMNGVYQMGPSANGSAQLSYQLKDLGVESSWDQRFESGDSFDFTVSVEMEDRRFTKCSAHDQFVTLSSQIDLVIDQKHADFSLIVVDDGSNDFAVAWSWESKPCTPEQSLYNRTFVSYYRAYNNRNYQAILDFQGDRGTFKSDAGFVGYFSQIRYSAEGRVAEGRWDASGSGGWFRFEIIEATSGRFEGEWGDSNGVVGRWWGYYQ